MEEIPDTEPVPRQETAPHDDNSYGTEPTSTDFSQPSSEYYKRWMQYHDVGTCIIAVDVKLANLLLLMLANNYSQPQSSGKLENLLRELKYGEEVSFCYQKFVVLQFITENCLCCTHQ